MIRHMSDPLYSRVFEAQAAANIMSAPYVQKNIEAAVKYQVEELKIWPSLVSINPRFTAARNESYVEVFATTYSGQTSAITADELFELCDPESISINYAFEYTGVFRKKYPGVLLTHRFYAPVSADDREMLLLLGHVERHDTASYSVSCAI